MIKKFYNSIALLMVAISLPIQASENYTSMFVEYSDFKNITESEFNAANQIIERKLKGYSSEIYNTILEQNKLMFTNPPDNKTNNSFTMSINSQSDNKRAAISFIRLYKKDYGGCILVLDYDECGTLEPNVYNDLNNLFKIKTNSSDIYAFFREHENAHRIEGYTYVDDIKTLRNIRVPRRDVETFRRHYLEVFADLTAILNLKGSDALIDDVIKMRDASYFTTDDFEHYTSPYIEKLKGFDYENNNNKNNIDIVNNIFQSTFSLGLMKYDIDRVKHIIPKLISSSYILERSNSKRAKAIASYIRFKERYLARQQKSLN